MSKITELPNEIISIIINNLGFRDKLNLYRNNIFRNIMNIMESKKNKTYILNIVNHHIDNEFYFDIESYNKYIYTYNKIYNNIYIGVISLEDMIINRLHKIINKYFNNYIIENEDIYSSYAIYIMDNINNKDKIIHLLFDSPRYLGIIIESFRRKDDELYISCDYETKFYGGCCPTTKGFNFNLSVAEMIEINNYKRIHTYNIKLIDIDDQDVDKKDTDNVYNGTDSEVSDSD